MSYQVDSYGNAYFPAGVSVASIPATTGTQNKVLVPGPGGRISSASISQLITQSGGNLVSSIFGRTGVITALRGDYNTDQVTEGQALYFSNSRARKAINLTTFNTSGPATYDSTTGILNIPQYGSGIVGNYVPVTRTITINGQTADLSANRIFTIDAMVYPSVGIPLSNGTAWGTSIVDNSTNWNTAYSWGNHAGLYSLLGHTHTFASLTSKPTTLAGYGITDAATSAQGANADTAFGWGNHALAGYLTSFTETDPTVPSHVKAITTTNISNWNTAYTWGNHALAGYLTSFTETDPIWTSEKINYYTKTQADSRYLQSYTETDPIWTSEKANYALKTYVDTSISNLIDSAPTTLDTLNELAAALGDDANFSTTVTTLIGTKEPGITPGTTLQYWRGDKTWQTLPIYTLSGLGGVPTTRTLTINGVAYDLTANRSWSALPVGGVAGDILAKIDGTDYNATWIPNFTSTVQHTVKAGVALTKGQAVYVSSADGTNMIVSKASNASEQTSSKTLGLVAQNLAINGQGFVVTEGLLAGLNTSTANAGDPVWLGTDGNLIFGLLNKPTAPAHLVFIGVVTRVQSNNGEIFVKVQNGFELDELHDLSVKNPSDGDMIKYVASTGLWTKIAASTTNIVEGTNLYYTQSRFDTAFAAKSTSNLTEGTNLYYTQGRFDTAFAAKSTTNLTEGTNLYYTTARFDTRLATKSTTDLVEGTNLYYTSARANSDFDTRLATKSTTNLAEGTNLYYTDARVGTYLTNNSYATQTYVNTAVSNLVDAAPGTLNTLNELAAALGDDPNFATTVAASIGTKEPIITAGTTSQYWRGDKTWQTLPIYTLSGLGGQPQLNGTGFVKVSGTTVSYDNSTYYLASNPSGYITGISFANVSAKPTTIAGYGITDSLVYTTSTYSNPSWITDLAWSKITGAPAFITGNQNITLSGEVTGSGATSIVTTIANNAVTTAKINNSAVTAAKMATFGAGEGFFWAANTDGASIVFESTGDGASGGRALSNLLIALTDNGDEGLKVTTTGSELLYVNINQFQYKGNNVWHAGNLTNLNQLSNGPGYITGYTETDTLASVTGRGATTSSPITVTASEGREVAVYMASSYTTDDLVSGHEYGWYNDHWRLGMTRSGGAAGADFVIQWNGSRRLSLTNGGNLTVTGTINTTAASSRFGNLLIGQGTYKNSIQPIDDTNMNLSTPSGAVYVSNILYINGSTAWHQGNLTNLSQLTNGPGYITSSSLSGYLPLSGGSLSGVLTTNAQLAVADNIVIYGNNKQIQWNAAASSDLFISCIPNTRTIEIRNGNAGSPNYAACGLITGYATFTANVTVQGNLTVSSSNTTGGGIILADDGDIVDLNDAYCSMRFSYGVRIYSANRGGSPVITLANTGVVTASSFVGSLSGNATTASSISGFNNPTTAANANTIVYRDGSGDVAAREFVLTASTIHVDTPSSMLGIYPTTNQVVKFGSTASRNFLNVPTRTGGDATGTWAINITGSATDSSTDFLHSNRDFPNGTLVQTSIAYGEFGDPFVLEIRGNSYFNQMLIDIQIQGYIYGGTIIATGGLSNGKPISVRAIRVGGNLAFWWPTGGYWEGFNIKVYTAYAGRVVNKVTSITNSSQPTTDKQVDFSLVQSLHSSNYNSYSPTLTGGNASGTWGINITGSAATATDSTKLPLAGGTLTGNLLFANSGTTKRGIQGVCGDNDFWFIGGGATGSNAGFLEIATGDDGQSSSAEPIYVRQYGPGDVLTGTLVRTAALLDASGNTSFPGTVTAPTFSGNLSGNATNITAHTINQSVGTGNTPTFAGAIIGCGVSTGRGVYGPGTLNLILTSSSAGSDGVSGIDFRSGNNYPSDGASIYYENSQTGSGEVSRLVFRVENDLNDSILMRAGYHVYNARTVDNASQGADNPVFRWQYLDSNRMTLDSSGNLVCNGDITAFSDARVKTDVKVIENSIEKVKSIRGVTFLRTDAEEQHKEKRHAGVIAQEILEVLPEVVTTDKEGMHSVAYGNLVALLIEGMKEQQAQIEELKKEIKELKNK